MFSFSFSVSREELIKSVRQYLIASGTIKKIWLSILTRLSFLALVLFLLSHFAWWSVIMVSVLAAGWIAVYFVFIRYPSEYAKRYAFLNNLSTVTLADDGLTFQSAEGETKYEWNGFVSFLKCNDFYFLTLENKNYLFFPRRVFEGMPEKVKEIEQFVASSCKNLKRCAAVNVLVERKPSMIDNIFNFNKKS